MPASTINYWRLRRKTIHLAFTISTSTTLRDPPSRTWRHFHLRSLYWKTNFLCHNQTPQYIVAHQSIFKVTQINRRSISFCDTSTNTESFIQSIPIKYRTENIMWISSLRYKDNNNNQDTPPLYHCDDLTTDASVKYGKASYGAVIHHNNQLPLASGRIHGPESIMNSFRAEAGGVATMILNKQLRPKWFYCDNKELVDKLQSTIPLHLLSPDWEYVEPTRLIFYNTSTSSYHVKGH